MHHTRENKDSQSKALIGFCMHFGKDQISSMVSALLSGPEARLFTDFFREYLI